MTHWSSDGMALSVTSAPPRQARAAHPERGRRECPGPESHRAGVILSGGPASSMSRPCSTASSPPACQRRPSTRPSAGAWLHEIKHDGFRVIARKDGDRVRLYTRNGHDFSHRFPLIVEAVTALRSRSAIIDGEAVTCGDDGVPSFDRIRYRRHDADVFLYAFDLIELDGGDLRREPLATPESRNGAAIGNGGRPP
jgi:ATP-dependent DNA ligase